MVVPYMVRALHAAGDHLVTEPSAQKPDDSCHGGTVLIGIVLGLLDCD